MFGWADGLGHNLVHRKASFKRGHGASEMGIIEVKLGEHCVSEGFFIKEGSEVAIVGALESMINS